MLPQDVVVIEIFDNGFVPFSNMCAKYNAVSERTIKYSNPVYEK